MDTKENPIVGYLDDVAIESLKKQHNIKHAHEVITEDEEGEKHATYFKKPELSHLQLLADYAKKGQEMDGLKVLFNTCRISGSEAVVTDDEMRVVAYSELAKIFKRREAIVKKR